MEEMGTADGLEFWTPGFQGRSAFGGQQVLICASHVHDLTSLCWCLPAPGGSLPKASTPGMRQGRVGWGSPAVASQRFRCVRALKAM